MGKRALKAMHERDRERETLGALSQLYNSDARRSRK